MSVTWMCKLPTMNWYKCFWYGLLTLLKKARDMQLVYMITDWFFFLSGCSFMTQQREFRPNKLCNIPTLTIWISRIYLPSPVNSISLCLRKHTCNYHPYTCLDTTFALTKICLLCVKTNYKFSLSFQNHERFSTLLEFIDCFSKTSK